jgi:hypothetical protein
MERDEDKEKHCAEEMGVYVDGFVVQILNMSALAQDRTICSHVKADFRHAEMVCSCRR